MTRRRGGDENTGRKRKTKWGDRGFGQGSKVPGNDQKTSSSQKGETTDRGLDFKKGKQKKWSDQYQMRKRGGPEEK